MKNLYPNDLVQRPTGINLDHDSIHVGDVVYLQPKDGGPAIRSTVIFDTPLFGCTTYTSDALVRPARGERAAQPVRFRFRMQDVHKVQPARG
ncbi:hypothetical protein FXN63_20885 [Pigmentiphaga aceris]|uniref:Uncharacterized protein n=1 Tax=Pigmentiphaga aceris TaxID=1940612 RepID=A0A5C0B590_9BURK|nr:hypothetical protein [Pigmentiphaga aceris]QEI08021.1 hypothetical protein FXN63_20885 [Pigmentiphaga aceris]